MTKAKIVATLVILIGVWVCVPNLYANANAHRQSLSVTNPDLDNKLFVAVSLGTVTEIRELLKQGAEVNDRMVDGVTAVMLAAGVNSNPEVITTLLEHGAEVNARDEYGLSALMYAAQLNPNPEVITVLLQAGAEVKARREDGATALMIAARMNSNPEVITALLKAGADAKAKDYSGKTAMDYAKENEILKSTNTYWTLVNASY